ncbi:MAG TPA: pentapeptide repeat-containing protein [Gammaproteobacteria bacterium]|nr:pentapeptide repeat-containing protein [Gammaproteobacteria bacterium]
MNGTAAVHETAEFSMDVEARLVKLEARLIEQDHRFIPVVTAFLSSRRLLSAADPRREAAFRALLWSLFYSPATVAIGGSMVALITLGVLIWQNLLVREQNDYLRRQIDQQQVQIEAQQRIDNQTVRNTAIEQIFGPQFASNPRVRAEAVRSLITVERARISQGSNTLPTEWVNLHEADLTDAWLESADLRKTSFRKSVLERSNLSAARLEEASIRHTNARKADFLGTDLQNANIAFSDLNGAQLTNAKLRGAAFLTCDLTNADLSKADLAGATLYRTQLMNADLSGIQNWEQIKSIEQTNIFGIRNAPAGFEEWARAHGAVSDVKALQNLTDLWDESLRLEESVGNGDN